MVEHTPAQDTGLPLGDIALDVVRRSRSGPEKYVIHPQGPAVIEAAVQAVLLSGEAPAAMTARLKRVVLVCYVLAEKEGSPKAAAVLARALFKVPEVMALLGGADRESRQRGQAYRKFLDDKDVARAPKLGDRAPADALRLSSFLPAGQQDMTSRVRQAAAKRQAMEARAGVRPAARPGPTQTPRTEGATENSRSSQRRLPPGARKV